MKEKPRWTQDKIIARIQELYAQGVPMNNNGIRQADVAVYEAAKYHFKSVRSAIEAAGFTYRNAQQIWSTERVIATIQAAHADGVPMRMYALEKYAPGISCACNSYFNSASAAIIAAGFKPGWEPKAAVLRPRKVIIATPVIPRSLRPTAFELFHDATPKNNGVVLNRIVSPLGMSEVQRIQQGG